MGAMVHQHHHRPSNQLQWVFLHGVSVTSLGGMVHQHCHRPQLQLIAVAGTGLECGPDGHKSASSEVLALEALGMSCGRGYTL